MEYSKILADLIVKTKILGKKTADEIFLFITAIKEDGKGDYTLPCFSFAKEFKKSPMILAEEIKNAILNNAKNDMSKLFDKCETINGYLNFFLNKQHFCEEVINKVLKEKDAFFSKNVGKGKKIAIDFSSANIAKHFHIGHLRNTSLGATISRLYENYGYKVIRLNYLGDYGSQFGDLFAAAEKLKIDLTAVNADELQDIYAKSKEMAENDESIKKEGRKWFAKLNEGNKECIKLYNAIKKTTLNEAHKIFEEFNLSFDSFKGEFFYNKYCNEIVKELKTKNITNESNGAQIVDLTSENLFTAVIVSSEGYSLYITRDIAAAIEREKEYKFDKLIYITGTEQILNFKQLFRILELMKKPVKNKLVHVTNGMYRLEEGKLSSRHGRKALLKDILAEAKLRAKNIILEKGRFTDEKEIENLASKIGKAALVFSALNLSINKDIIFNLDRIVSFDGETGPYLQYVCARINSLFEKAGNVKIKYENPDIITEEEFKLAKLINGFNDVCELSLREHDPSFLARYLIDVGKMFNKFYNENKIISDNKKETSYRLAIAGCVREVLQKGLTLLGVPIVDKM